MYRKRTAMIGLVIAFVLVIVGATTSGIQIQTARANGELR